MPSFPPTPPNHGFQFCNSHHDTYAFINSTNSSHAGHKVLITGSSKGVGRATALSFASSGASAIAIAARSSFGSLPSAILSAARSAGHAPPQILELEMDVTDYGSVAAAAEKVEQEFKDKLDIVINNAGYLGGWEPIVDSDPEEWWMNYEVNIKGTYHVSRAFLPLLLGPHDGMKTVVNVTSAGAHALSPGASGYQGSKFAMLRLTEFLMVDYADKGLLSYAVHPCGTKTELGSNMPEHMYRVFTDTPEIAADAMSFLTRERREWLGGRYVNCCWDMGEFLGKEKEVVERDLLRMKMVL